MAAVGALGLPGFDALVYLGWAGRAGSSGYARHDYEYADGDEDDWPEVSASCDSSYSDGC